MKEKGHFLAHPDALISAVGTKVHSFDGESWREDAAWTAQLDKDWDLVAVRDAAYKALTQVGYAAFSHPLLWIIHVCGTAQPTKRVDGACVHRQRRLGELQQMRRKGESLWEGKAWQEVYSWCRLVQIWALCSHGVDGEDAHAWAPGSSLAGEAAGCEQQTHGYSCQQLAPKACCLVPLILRNLGEPLAQCIMQLPGQKVLQMAGESISNKIQSEKLGPKCVLIPLSPALALG
eukprot:1159006-Pelagomonas_calceolata.AAC.6